ncbi:hypothetical protein CC80DRAFT_270579 [Byssothecium circinans]|uniref:Uncharacterized protein n=1 Tax=Byssothecium circinans TaxID=147558 RepID=A0A6A5T970_9PLEO|nr:hypothetical protein CC80DRAFT_270579 [Byssothecium circinans]
MHRRNPNSNPISRKKPVRSIDPLYMNATINKHKKRRRRKGGKGMNGNAKPQSYSDHQPRQKEKCRTSPEYRGGAHHIQVGHRSAISPQTPALSVEPGIPKGDVRRKDKDQLAVKTR